MRRHVPWREGSLRTRLTVLVASAMAAAVVVMWLSTWLLLRANLYVEFDAQLQTYAQVAAKLAKVALQDELGSRLGRKPKYVPAVGRPGELALMSTRALPGVLDVDRSARPSMAASAASSVSSPHASSAPGAPLPDSDVGAVGEVVGCAVPAG